MILTPKEEAKELVDKFIPHTRVFHEILGWTDYIYEAKQCALIAVDNILFVIEFNLDFKMERSIKYYLEVKQEIDKL